MRFSTLFGFGAVLTCAALLAACGGGGHSGGLAGGIPGGTQQSANNSGPGSHVTVYIHAPSGKVHPRVAKRRAKIARRDPKYLSTHSQNGLQISVAAAGATTQTVYVDVSSGSPLCTPTSTNSGSERMCTLTIPTVGANEQISALETDSAPQNENGSGYGTGFATGTNILAAVNQTQSVTMGASNSFGIELGPVSALFYDCTGEFNPPSPLPQYSSANFGHDSNVGGDLLSGTRIVVTGGVAASGSVQINFCDVGEDYQDYDTTPAPFVDVNASPTPITVTSNSSAVTLAAFPNTSTTAPPASAYSATASIPNDGYYWQNTWLVVGIQTTAALSSTATMTVNNNLTALNSFLTPPSSYANTMTYTVVPITVSATTATVSAAGGTAIVTGTDSNASDPMDAESAYTAGDENCNTGGGTTLATISPGSLNTTNWTQPFTITGASNGTGTCTFYIYDTDAGTVTLPITVTVN